MLSRKEAREEKREEEALPSKLGGVGSDMLLIAP
jgi:hypothetical protein